MHHATKEPVMVYSGQQEDRDREGVPYQTRLDPPPADPRVAHPVTEP